MPNTNTYTEDQEELKITGGQLSLIRSVIRKSKQPAQTSQIINKEEIIEEKKNFEQDVSSNLINL